MQQDYPVASSRGSRSTTPPPPPHSTRTTTSTPHSFARFWNSISSTSHDSDSGHALTMTENDSDDGGAGDASLSMSSPGLPRLLSNSTSGNKEVGEPVLTRSMARGSTTTPTTSPPSTARKSWCGIGALPKWAAGPTPSVDQLESDTGYKEDEFQVLDRTEFDQDQLERDGGLFDWHTPGAYPLGGEEGVVIDDEACFVDSLEGKVDFISSLPQEISLYILLHLDLEALLVTSLVSRQWRLFSLDNLLWRDLFHQQKHWKIRETPLPPPMPPFPLPTPTSTQKLKRVASSAIDGGERSFSKRSGHENGATTEGNGRISRTLSDLMSDLSSLSFASRAGPSDSSPSNPAVRRPRTNSSTTPAPFPPLTSITSSTTPESPVLSQSTSSLSRTTSSTGIPSLSSSTLLSPSRRTSSATLPPLGPVPSPSLASTPSAPLALDWPRLYKDRFLLEKRWEKNTPKTTMLRGHTDSVYCLQFDDHKVISGSRDRTIKIWDLHQGICVESLTGHAGSVLCLQYDQTILVTGSSDSRILVWHLVGEKKFTIKMQLVGHAMGVLDLSFDDKWIVSCSKDTTIRVWHRENGELYRVLSGHRGPINAVQLLNGKVVSASGDCHLKLWDIESGSVLRVFVGHERGLACVQYSPSGNLIATGAIDKVIKIWDANSGECLNTLKGHTDLVRSLAFDEVNRRVVSASYDRTVRLWNLDTGETLHKFSMHTSWVFDVKFSTSRILSSSHDQRIIVLDFGSGLDVSQFAS